jgi:hypothetical protein
MNILLDVNWREQRICIQEITSPEIVWSVKINENIIKGASMVTLTDIQKVSLSIQPIDAKGNPAVVDGIPVWQVSDTALLSLVVAEDGLSAELLAVGPLGTGQVTVAADALIGEGVVPITGILDVTVIASQAASLAISAGVPENQ